MKTTPLDQFHALLFLEGLSRTHFNFVKNPNVDWASFKSMEKAFLAKYPSCETEYKKFMESETDKWKALFGEQFKKHSLSTYVFNKWESLES